MRESQFLGTLLPSHPDFVLIEKAIREKYGLPELGPGDEEITEIFLLDHSPADLNNAFTFFGVIDLKTLPPMRPAAAIWQNARFSEYSGLLKPAAGFPFGDATRSAKPLGGLNVAW